jgi:hypothetical protein
MPAGAAALTGGIAFASITGGTANCQKRTTPMRTTEIPRADWSRFLAEFSAAHDGWLVSLDILSPDIGAQPDITDLPLVGLTFADIRAGTMTISAGRSAVAEITHTVQAPSHIWVERTDAGADAALAIESADGAKTILRLRTAALPETVDGIARGPHRNPGSPGGPVR